MTWETMVVMVSFISLCSNERNNGTILDFAELQSSIQTDLIFLDQLNHRNNQYKFEDFFWTGSGDGPYDKDEEPWVIEPPTTVFLTTTATVTTTVHSGSDEIHHKITPENSTPPDTDNLIDADKEFWIVTVIKTDGKDPELADLKNRLVKLYKKAFQRQQDRHLGLGYKRRRRKAAADTPVNVYIHQVDPKNLNGEREVEVLYHVAVSGKPVSAITAVADMSLISDEEVKQELGFPTLIKAEPYLKPSKAQSLSRAKNTWIVIGGSIMSFLVLLLLLAFLTLGCTKRKRSQQAGIDNKRQIFERSVEDLHCKSAKKRGESPTYINFQNAASTESLRSGVSAKSAVYLSPSTSSSTSLDISPPMTARKSTPPKKPPRPRAALNKTAPVNVKIPQDVYDSDGSSTRRNSLDVVFEDGTGSPKSYLSMPSIKSFPRIANPEPLTKVLEPVSMLHLDMPEDAEVEITHIPYSTLTRHGSIGANADPGVIGPVVWDLHCKTLQHCMSVDEGMNDLVKTSRQTTRMRKRFNELIDDTFSLFGSRLDVQDEGGARKNVETKSRSANVDVLRWAVSTVMTRQNMIPSDDGETKVSALIPLWDLCNHTNGMISTDFNPELNRSECLALQDFKKGDQLFIFYGPRTNAEFFIHNGFVPKDNKYDFYPVRLGISKCDPLKEKRIQLLKKLNLENAQEFKLGTSENPIDGKLLAFLRTFNMNEGQLDHWIKSNKSSDLEYIECALDVSLEKKSWTFLQTRLKLMLATYRTSLEQDKTILEEKKLSSNALLAVRMRASEKEIIWRTLNWLEQHVQQ